jgi:thymidylate kinase
MGGPPWLFARSYNRGVSPRVVITGPPAAGKTTVCSAVVRWLAERGHRLEAVSVDEAIRRLYPRETESPDYAYDDEGAIVLHRPADQIPPAVGDAVDACRRAAGGFVLELASNECLPLLARGRDLLPGALVFALAASVELRSRRNACRGVTLIPDDRLRQYPDHLPGEWVRELEAAGARVVAIDADRPLDAVTAEILDELARTF